MGRSAEGAINEELQPTRHKREWVMKGGKYGTVN